MRLLKFLGKRSIHGLFVILGLSILIFVIARVMPGKPARMALGSRASPRAIEKLRNEMHLNDPLYVQYVYWVKDALQGDFGKSLRTRRDVVEDIKRALPASLELALFVGLLSGVMGIFLGTLSGWYSNTWIDNVVRVFSYLGIVTPSFVFAIFFVLIFSYGFELLPTIGRLSSGVAPPERITGMIVIDSLLSGNFTTLIDGLKHLILPVISLAMGSMAQEARITRASMTDNIKKDYIAAERACGIPEHKIMFKYLLKPSLIPTVSIFGLDFAATLGNAFLVERVFNWPGLSYYAMEAMLQKDLNAMTATVLVFGIAFMVVNIFVDLVVEFLDPRIRLRVKE